MPTDRTCSVCEKPLPVGRTKYCGRDCEKAAHRARALEYYHSKLFIKARRKHRKMRGCLDCHRKFLSDGPWNRICPRCKGRFAERPVPRERPARLHGLKISKVI
jgi:hypothetical protein